MSSTISGQRRSCHTEIKSQRSEVINSFEKLVALYISIPAKKKYLSKRHRHANNYVSKSILGTRLSGTIPFASTVRFKFGHVNLSDDADRTGNAMINPTQSHMEYRLSGKSVN